MTNASSIIGCSLLLFSILFKLIGSSKAKWQRALSAFGSCLIILSFFWLLYALFSFDYSLDTVYKSISNQLPTGYRLSAMWASHEGSMLLWLCLMALGNLWLLVKAPNLRVTLLVFNFIEMLYGCYVLFSSNPFLPSAGRFTQGLGLNPLLQDVALSIHPPILYAGYISCLIPFAMAIEVLANGQVSKRQLQLMFASSNWALILMSAGIFLGSWWAYRELDWGGYWFFNPVENISLLPWLVTISLHHCLMLQLKKPKIELLRYCLLLAILAFGIVAFGFFFVRSGVISSVHSFAFSSARGAYLLTISLIINLLGVGFYLYKGSNLAITDVAKTQANNLSKNIFIIFASYNWLLMCFVLIIAIIYPIYGMYVLDIDMAIAPDYYHKIFLPLGALSVAFASLAMSSTSSYLYGFIALLASLIMLYLLSLPVFAILFLAPSLCLLMISLVKYKAQRQVAGYRHNIRPIAILLAHSGFALLVIAITLNTYQSHQLNFKGGIGDSTKSPQLQATLTEIKHAKGPNYLRQIYLFTTTVNDGTNITLRPENRLYQAEKTLAQEADIYSFLLYDLYAIGRKNNNNIVQAEIHIKPLMSLIWLACAFVVLGLLFAFFELLRKINQNC